MNNKMKRHIGWDLRGSKHRKLWSLCISSFWYNVFVSTESLWTPNKNYWGFMEAYSHINDQWLTTFRASLSSTEKCVCGRELHFVLQSQTCPLFQVSLDFLLLHFNPLWWKGRLVLVLAVEGLIGLEPVNFSFFSISGWDIILDYCDAEYLPWEMNWDHSVIFEFAPKYCI